MRRLNLTLDSHAGNLALDEALLDEAQRAGRPCEVLRLWEPPSPLVVIGRSSDLEAEVDVAACDQRRIPILRRASGGAAIMTGPGCLMYALVLSYELRPALRSLDRAHAFVLDTMANALAALVPGVTRQGASDLALDSKKFSGNSVRCKRSHFLYHGTLLYDFPLDLIGRCLHTAPQQPEYREGRSHDAFVTNLPASRNAILEAITDIWAAREPRADWPEERVERLLTDKYGQHEWTFRSEA